MIVSKSKRFIYIHVPKTGGTSMTEILERHSSAVLKNKIWTGRIIRHFGEKVSNKLYLFEKHIRAEDALNKIGTAKFNDYFKFGFMRNPFDFIVSSYFYQKADKSNINYSLVNSFADFSEFIHKMPHSSSYQKDFITIDNSVVLDFVGNFNDFENSLHKLEKMIGIKFNELPQRNKSEHNPYTSYYNIDLKKEVFKLYQDDVELYNELFKTNSEDF